MKNNIEKVTIPKLKKFTLEQITRELNRRFLERATDEQLLKVWKHLDKDETTQFFNSLR